MDYSTILYDVDDGILTITLNRPEALNAFTNDMLMELIDACDRADADDNISAIIVTGAGRGFCAGADLSRGASTFDSGAREDREDRVNRDGGGRLTLRLYELNKPIIAAINGAAVGVGVTMRDGTKGARRTVADGLVQEGAPVQQRLHRRQWRLLGDRVLERQLPAPEDVLLAAPVLVRRY